MNVRLSLLDMMALSPLLIVLVGALLILLLESFHEKLAKRWSFPLTLATLAVALLALYGAPSSQNILLTHWVRFDALGRFFTAFFLLIGIGVACLSSAFFKRFENTHGEYYFLLLCSLFGLILIGSASDFLTLFLGIETLSIALYILCAYMKKWGMSQEASIKYFLMGSLAAAFLLYGIALIYGAVGTTHLSGLLKGYQNLSIASDKLLFLSGVVFLTFGLAFKAAIVPFHIWAPDVYDGAPNPVTAFMAVGTKVGAFAALARVFLEALPNFDPFWNHAMALLAFITLVYANFVALQQTQLRRFFAYSGISHAGFLLIPFAAGGNEALPALLLYLVVYAIATLGAFSILAFLDKGSQGAMLEDLNGLFQRAPFLTCVFALCLLTLAGIPPFIGFFAKFYIFMVAFKAGYYGLVIAALLTTILSAYYYLRMIGAMFTPASTEAKPSCSWPAVTLGCASFVILGMVSFFPGVFLNFLSEVFQNPRSF